MRDFHDWMKDNGKKIEISEGSAKRAGVRAHAYPPAYNRAQYAGVKNDNPAALTPTAADAAYYLTNKDAD
jgi:hypothetical protein